MFNCIQKQRYIDERTEEVKLSPNYIGNLFNIAEEFENKYEKDISNWTTPEIISWYKWLSKPSINSLLTINSTLKSYTQWCLQNNLVPDHQNHFLEISIEIIGKCVNLSILGQRTISRKELLLDLKRLVNPLDRFIILAIYEGIRGKELCELINLKTTDIDGNYANLCTGRKIKISNELKNMAFESANTYIYYAKNGEGAGRKKELIGGETEIIKLSPNVINTNAVAISHSIGVRIARLLEFLKMTNATTVGSLYDAGQVNCIIEMAEKEGKSVTEFINTCDRKEVEKEIKSRYPEFTMYKFIVKYIKSKILD